MCFKYSLTLVFLLLKLVDEVMSEAVPMTIITNKQSVEEQALNSGWDDKLFFQFCHASMIQR